MQMPQIVESISSLLQNSVALRQQAQASKKSSRDSPRRQFVPDGAFAGQISTQAVQVPHIDSSHGGPVSIGASVRTVVSRIAEPKGFVITRAFFPIQPSPERVAAILWDKPRPKPHRVEFLRCGLKRDGRKSPLPQQLCRPVREPRKKGVYPLVFPEILLCRALRDP